MGQSLGLKLDTRTKAPLYQQVFDSIVERVRTGVFPSGFRLPPTRTLAGALGTHRNTIVRAYEELVAAGFALSTVGRGTFVAQPPNPGVRAGLSRIEPPGGAGLPWASLIARTSLGELLTRADRLQRSLPPMSTDTINLSRLEPDATMIPDELIRRCTEHVMRTQGGKVLRYAARDGIPRLRALIAEDLSAKGVPARAEDIVITSGSQQGLDLLTRVLVNPGDAFLVDELTFAGTLSVLAASGARVVGVPWDEEGPSLAGLERLGQIGAKGLYLMPNSHNPTGATITEARREAIVAWSRRTGVPIIEDDYVADLQLGETPAPAPLRAFDGDVVYVGSFSKRLAPGLRVGFVVAPPALRPRIVQLKYAMETGGSELLQHVLAEFMERGYLKAHIARIVPEYRVRCQALEASLRRHLPGTLRWRQPERGLALWLPLPSDVSSQDLFVEAQRLGVLIHPGSLNHIEERTPTGIRLAFCSEPSARLVEAGKRIGRAAATVMTRSRSSHAVPALGGI